METKTKKRKNSKTTKETSKPKPPLKVKTITETKAKQIFAPFVPKDWQKRGLTLKQCLFIAEYLTNGFIATTAYMKAYKVSTYNVAGVEANRLIKNVKIRRIIQEYFNDYLGEKKLKLEKEIITVLYTRAFYDPSMFIQPDGQARYKTWTSIPKKYRVCIEGIETKVYGTGQNQVTKTFIKLADREKAMEKLGKYITLFAPDAMTLDLKMTEETANKLANVFKGSKE